MCDMQNDCANYLHNYLIIFYVFSNLAKYFNFFSEIAPSCWITVSLLQVQTCNSILPLNVKTIEIVEKTRHVLQN